LCKRRHGSPSIELKFTSLSTSRKFAMQRVSGVHAKQGLSCDPGKPDKKPRTITSNHNISSGRSGEGYSALRGWRPIPAALHPPIRRSLFRGGRPSLSPTGQNFPDEAVSIGKVTGYVKRKSISKRGKLFEFSSLPRLPLHPPTPTVRNRTRNTNPRGSKVLILQLATRSLPFR
jgi:hypothetical protein